MSPPLEPDKKDQPNTYFVQDRQSEQELTRLTLQDRMITAGMGGVLSEQPDPSGLRRVLDVGCGTGGWMIEAARLYPEIELIGIDISQRMIEYARAQARVQGVEDRVEFQVMDALLILEFPTSFFDLVNMRLGSSFLRTWEWSKVLGELRRVVRPGGVIRVTECEVVQSHTPALARLNEMHQCALFRSGHLFVNERSAMTSHLVHLLKQYKCGQVQSKAHTIEIRAGMSEDEAFSRDMMLAFQTFRPFMEKWGCIAPDYDLIYQQAFDELRQPGFSAVWNFLTAWGIK